MQIDMTALARAGAQARLTELGAEMDALRRAFPEMAEPTLKKRGRPAAATPAAREPEPAPKKNGMSPAARKAVARRMKAYWAAKREEKATPAPAAKTPEPVKAEAAPAKAKRTMSAEGKARIAAAQKKRWAAVKRGKKR
jgi:hypothetical protein